MYCRSLNVTYSATSSFVPVSGNTYDVFLTVDPSGFSAGNGYLTAISMQFKTGSDVATSVTLISAPGGTSDWNTDDAGGLNKNGCDGANPTSGDACFQNNGANTAVPGGPYYFEFAVTMAGTDALTAGSDIKAAYNTLANNSGKNLGLTSMGITIQQADAPEPGTLGLLSARLVGLSFMLKRTRRSHAV